MLANIIIMALILGYCAYIIYKNVKNAKEGKHMGCSGCSGNCGSCGGCSGAAFNKSTAQSSKTSEIGGAVWEIQQDPRCICSVQSLLSTL